MNQVKKGGPKKLQSGIPLEFCKGHTILLETTEEPLTVHTGPSPFYAMVEALELALTLDQHIHIINASRQWNLSPMPKEGRPS